MHDASSRDSRNQIRGRTLSAARRLGRFAVLTAVLSLGACAPQRLLTIESYPPGALVRLDDQVIGRTPLDHSFDHYGKRRITLYLPGYRTWSRRLDLSPPWHARFPIDVVTELLVPIGLRDRHEVWVVLENDEVVGGHPDLGPLLERAREMRARGTQITPAEEAPAEGEAEAEAEGEGAPQAEAPAPDPAEADAGSEPEADAGGESGAER